MADPQTPAGAAPALNVPNLTQDSARVVTQEVSPPGKPFHSPEVEARFKQLASELRCLVCQNQSLADSQAGLAEDLKAKVYQQIESGQSDADIKTYMVDRYGEFILYKPSFSSGNAVLWIGPFIILVIAVIAARGWLKGNSQKPSPAELIRQTGQEQRAAELNRLYEASKK
jgi:cytochrome c-type biogenesis protein CcmH